MVKNETSHDPNVPIARLFASWDQQPGESLEEHQLWRTYYDLGPGRTYFDLSKRTGLEEKALRKIGKRFDWETRTAAYRCHIDSLLTEWTKETIKGNARSALSSLVELIREECAKLFQQILLESRDSVTPEQRSVRLKNLTNPLNALTRCLNEDQKSEDVAPSISITFQLTEQGRSDIQITPKKRNSSRDQATEVQFEEVSVAE